MQSVISTEMGKQYCGLNKGVEEAFFRLAMYWR